MIFQSLLSDMPQLLSMYPYVLRDLIVAIMAFQPCIAGETNANQLNQSGTQAEVKTSDLGTRVALIGRYGKLGVKRTFVGVIRGSGTKKIDRQVIWIYRVDGRDVSPVLSWDIAMAQQHPAGAAIEFEGFEMGHLERIAPLNNGPSIWKHVGEIGCRLSLEAEKIIRVIPKSDAAVLLGNGPHDAKTEGIDSNDPFSAVTSSQTPPKQPATGNPSPSGNGASPNDSRFAPRQPPEGPPPAKPVSPQK